MLVAQSEHHRQETTLTFDFSKKIKQSPNPRSPHSAKITTTHQQKSPHQRKSPHQLSFFSFLERLAIYKVSKKTDRVVNICTSEA